MLYGKEKVEKTIAELEDKVNRREASAKEKGVLTTLEVVNEMYARGLKFLPIDLYRSHPSNFLADNGAIRPPLSAMPGFGGVAAENLECARAGEPFISVEDLMKRANMGKAAVELLKGYGVLDGLPESSQVSLFDLAL
jgi:DNA polymerase-3 subunit alpha (Gram-positive type)